MAVPTYQSVGTGSRIATSTDITITKPSSVAVGDILVALIGYRDVSARTINTLSGWTYLQGVSNTVGMYAFWKTATSGDVSATDYTFSASGTAAYMSGAIIRASGQAVGNETVSEYDTDNVTSTTLTYTTALTPTTAESLLVMAFVGRGASAPTLSGYTSTPSATWTERADLGIEDGATDFFYGIATAPYSSASQITSRGVTLSSASNSDGQVSVIVAINAPTDASGTVALHAVSPTFFAPSASAGTSGTAALHTASPTFFDPESYANQPPVWSNADKPANATFTNTPKP